MSKTFKSLIQEAEQKWDLWLDISNSPQALLDRGKTKEEAIMLANYFEGRLGALYDVKSLLK